MAYFQFILLLFCFFIYFHFQVHAQISSLSDTLLLLPANKDLATLQYLTQIDHGISQVPTKLVIDLGAQFLWVDCASGEVSSRRVIPSCSIQCSTAKIFHLGQRSCFCDTSSRPVNQYPSTCDLSIENGITRSATRGELAEDIIAVRSVDGSKSGEITKIDNFLLTCAPTALLNGLASGARGMLGLGRTPITLPSQLAAKFDFHKKFATCLSSSNGVILFGNMGSDSIFGPEISRSLTYTPLVTDPNGNSQEYFINVRSIKINGKKLALGREGIGGGTKISTTVPYATLESSIYGTFMKAYLKAASFMNMTRVDPVSPFGLCFNSKSIGSTILGPMVPAIDLVLQSEMVKWRIHGRNSMVAVNDEVMCLGLLDGGLDSKNSIVIGGFQIEDTVLEFDLGTSMLGFSLPLLMRQTSCSNFMLESRVKDSL